MSYLLHYREYGDEDCILLCDTEDEAREAMAMCIRRNGEAEVRGAIRFPCEGTGVYELTESVSQEQVEEWFQEGRQKQLEASRTSQSILNAARAARHEQYLRLKAEFEPESKE